MIFVGLDEQEKQREANRYLADHPEINRVVVFYPKQFPPLLQLPDSLTVQSVEYAEIIMYRTFYPLLEVIDPNTLLVFTEIMRTQNRSDLTYNCAHHYCNQTPHKLIFETFPFIDDPANFMILLDLQDKGRYKGKGFDYSFLTDEGVVVRPHHFSVSTIEAELPSGAEAKYEKKKQQLFDALGNGDPDTIPRQLHVFVGGSKRGAIEPATQYVARNSRFNLPNVTTYQNIPGPGDYVVIDFAHRRLDFSDFLKRSGMHHVRFINTGLKVDLYYLHELRAWIERLEAFYAQASIRTEVRS